MGLFQLDEEQRLILQSVREIVQKEIKPRSADLDETGEFPWDTVRIFAKNDLLNPLLPRSYGGVEVSTSTFCMILEEIAKVCYNTAYILVMTYVPASCLLEAGNKEQKDFYLEQTFFSCYDGNRQEKQGK